jgi:(S)-mandelate dehydrogenase
MKRRRYQGTDVARALTIEDLRQMARRRAPNFAFEYVEGGAEEEVTLHRNRAVFDDIALIPRTLVDVSNRRLGIQLFGQDSALPFLIGPTGFNGFMTHEGDIELAIAAARAGIPFTLSTVSTAPAAGSGCSSISTVTATGPAASSSGRSAPGSRRSC